MTMREYQDKAERTINKGLTFEQVQNHALFGLCSEVGEIQSFYQKQYQGHMIDNQKLKLEVGDAMWFIAELCTAHGWSLNEIAEMNINKLIARYPDGFSADRSVHREEYK